MHVEFYDIGEGGSKVADLEMAFVPRIGEDVTLWKDGATLDCRVVSVRYLPLPGVLVLSGSVRIGVTVSKPGAVA